MEVVDVIEHDDRLDGGERRDELAPARPSPEAASDRRGRKGRKRRPGPPCLRPGDTPSRRVGGSHPIARRGTGGARSCRCPVAPRRRSTAVRPAPRQRRPRRPGRRIGERGRTCVDRRRDAFDAERLVEESKGVAGRVADVDVQRDLGVVASRRELARERTADLDSDVTGLPGSHSAKGTRRAKREMDSTKPGRRPALRTSGDRACPPDQFWVRPMMLPDGSAKSASCARRAGAELRHDHVAAEGGRAGERRVDVIDRDVAGHAASRAVPASHRRRQ